MGLGSNQQATAALDRSRAQPASMRADDAHYPAVLCPWYWYRRYAAGATLACERCLSATYCTYTYLVRV